jgi:hypothetical protein
MKSITAELPVIPALAVAVAVAGVIRLLSIECF